MALEQVPQWMAWVTVSHGPKFVHRVQIDVVSKGRDPFTVDGWNWSGTGVPPHLPETVSATITSVVTEHLVTRYGVAHSLF